MKKKMKKNLAILCTIMAAAAALAGCSNGAKKAAGAKSAGAAGTEQISSQAESAAAAGKANGTEDSALEKTGKTFGVTYWIESDFFKTIGDSITEAAKADGNKTVVVDAQQDSAKQIQIIEDFIAQDVSAVFLNPVDKDAIEPALQKLKEAGIPVINFDSAVANLDMVDAYVATDNVQAGRLCGEAMIKDFPQGGKIAVLDYPANSACVDREKGFLDTIQGKGFDVAATFDAQGTVEKGQNITSDILQAHPDISAIFSINDQAGMGAYAACTTSGKNVYIYGVDGAPETKQVIAKKGSIYRMTAAQSPIKIGTKCYEAAKTILEGKKPERFQIDVPAFTIDSSNIQDYLGAGWQ